MNKIIVLVLAGLVGIGGLFFLALQFGGISTAAYDKMTGEEIFTRICSQCHGVDGVITHGKGETYTGKRQYWDEEKLLRYIKNPTAYQRKNSRLKGRYMPPVDGTMPLAARQRLAAHVLGLMDELEAE